MIVTPQAQALALSRLTHTPVPYNQLLVAPAQTDSGKVGVSPMFIFGELGGAATAVYLTSKIAANIIAIGAAVRQYGYSKDNADLADAYSKMAERRRANYDIAFQPREATYVGIVRAEPIYAPNYVASDALAAEAFLFTAYPRMRGTTPEIDTAQRDNFQYGVNTAYADSLDYGRRREENKADKKNEDRSNILYATAQFSFGAGEASAQIARYGTEMYTRAVSVRSEYVTSAIKNVTAGFMANIEMDRTAQRNAIAERKAQAEIPATAPNLTQPIQIAGAYFNPATGRDINSGLEKY